MKVLPSFGKLKKISDNKQKTFKNCKTKPPRGKLSPFVLPLGTLTVSNGQLHEVEDSTYIL
jgi:hypothetical protein